MKSDDKAFFIGVGAGIFGALAGPPVVNFIRGNTELTIPTTKNVESGFVIPSKLEIKCQDLDGNGTPETILRYEGKNYLLKYDGNQPSIVPYEVKPAQVVPK